MNAAARTRVATFEQDWADLPAGAPPENRLPIAIEAGEHTAGTMPAATS